MLDCQINMENEQAIKTERVATFKFLGRTESVRRMGPEELFGEAVFTRQELLDASVDGFVCIQVAVNLFKFWIFIAKYVEFDKKK